MLQNKTKTCVMKKQILTLTSLLSGLLLISLFFACDDRERGIDLQENEENREEVYQQILNDEELFSEFMNEMRESRRSMEWMASDRPMMRNMYGRQQVQSMMKNHPEMMDSVMQEMMTMHWDTTRMHRNPQMRQRMMQNMMRMMEQDTAMYREMQERMQENRTGMGRNMR